MAENGTGNIHQMVKDNGGVVKVDLQTLRDELGHRRLGKHVLNQMAEHLSESGLGYFPGGTLDADENPTPRQWQEVWIYERDGSPRSAVLDAVSDPDNNDLVAALDMFSSDTPNFKKMSATQRLAYIRAAVCD